MMTTDTISAAPQVKITDSLYAAWLTSHTGTRGDLLQFLTSPSDDRDEFLALLYCETEIVEGVGLTTYNAYENGKEKS